MNNTHMVRCYKCNGRGEDWLAGKECNICNGLRYIEEDGTMSAQEYEVKIHGVSLSAEQAFALEGELDKDDTPKQEKQINIYFPKDFMCSEAKAMLAIMERKGHKVNEMKHSFRIRFSDNAGPVLVCKSKLKSDAESVINGVDRIENEYPLDDMEAADIISSNPIEVVFKRTRTTWRFAGMSNGSGVVVSKDRNSGYGMNYEIEGWGVDAVAEVKAFVERLGLTPTPTAVYDMLYEEYKKNDAWREYIRNDGMIPEARIRQFIKMAGG